MNGKRVRITVDASNPPQQQLEDLAWGRENEDRLFTQYGDCYVLIYRRQVVGSGTTIADAVSDAETKLDKGEDAITPAIHKLVDRSKAVLFGVVRSGSTR
ncbi:MAG: hypothetical protein IPM16_08750 [Chloroflexi bacterium]|nr:hypothetical protein [Chloroflexota bacterium]